MRVDRTKVGKGSRRGERVGEALIGVQGRGFLELIIGTRHDMRHVIMVSPNYRRARSNRDFFWQEAEVINSYLGLAGTGDRCLLWVASLRSHKA